MEKFLKDYSKSHYIEVSSTTYITCDKCTTELFFAFVNYDESVWLQCINCHERIKIDVYDGYTKLSDNNTHCRNCNNEKLNIMYGFAKGEYAQNWVYV